MALLRVLDPRLGDPFIRNLTYAAGLSFIAALPLFLFMNIAVVGRIGHIAASAGLAAILRRVYFLCMVFF